MGLEFPGGEAHVEQKKQVIQVVKMDGKIHLTTMEDWEVSKQLKPLTKKLKLEQLDLGKFYYSLQFAADEQIFAHKRHILTLDVAEVDYLSFDS
jgi:hypothetical protein